MKLKTYFILDIYLAHDVKEMLSEAPTISYGDQLRARIHMNLVKIVLHNVRLERHIPSPLNIPFRLGSSPRRTSYQKILIEAYELQRRRMEAFPLFDIRDSTGSLRAMWANVIWEGEKGYDDARREGLREQERVYALGLLHPLGSDDFYISDVILRRPFRSVREDRLASLFSLPLFQES